VLAMLGIAPPDTMDGHILTDLMKPLAVGVAAE